jgi:hypothetical protein
MKTHTTTDKLPIFALAATFGLVLTSPSARAEPIAFYNDSDFGSMATPNANSWGGSNKTNTSVIFEVFIDFTSTVADATAPFTIFENGADAVGSGVAIDGEDIVFAAGGSSIANTAVATGAHGLTAGETNVQILAVLEFGGGTDTNELLSLYVNGTLIASADSATGNDWAGINTSNLGITDSFNIFEFVPSINPNAGNNANGVFAGNFPDPDTTITFAAYELGVGDNTVENILVPSEEIRLVITEIDFKPEAIPSPTVTLTWSKTRAVSYVARFSPDMSNWGSDLDDGVTVDRDENPDDVNHITVTFPLNGPLDNATELFFRIEEGE